MTDPTPIQSDDNMRIFEDFVIQLSLYVSLVV